jgi:hypothetical protein
VEIALAGVELNRKRPIMQSPGSKYRHVVIAAGPHVTIDEGTSLRCRVTTARGEPKRAENLD